MAFTDTLKTIASKLLTVSAEGSSSAGIGYQKPVMPEMRYQDTVARYTTRQAKMTKNQSMALADIRISRILYKLSADAFVGDFDITVEQAPTESVKKKTQDAIDDFLKITDVKGKGRGWTKAMLRDGDLFLEVVVDPTANKIVRLKKLAAIITRSNMNAEGNFPENESAYFQVHPHTQKKVKEFESWQIIQVSWDREDGEPYGTGLFTPAQLTFDRLISAENNVSIRRQIRAGKRLIHIVGTQEKPSRWDQVAEYREYNKDTLEHPTDPVQDYWSNGLVDIKEIDSDRDIGDLRDIEYLEGLIPMQPGVPKAILGRDENINRDVLEEQEEDYYRVISDINNTLEAGLRKVIDFSLLLAGIDPLFVEYNVNWGNKDRTDLNDRIGQAKELQALGFSFESIFHFINLPKVDFEEEMERIRKQVQEGIVPYGIGMKVDPTVAMAVAAIAGSAKKGEAYDDIYNKLDKIRELAEGSIQPSGETRKNILALTGGK